VCVILIPCELLRKNDVALIWQYQDIQRKFAEKKYPCIFLESKLKRNNELVL